jgi:hypothetical protein
MNEFANNDSLLACKEFGSKSIGPTEKFNLVAVNSKLEASVSLFHMIYDMIR